MTKAKVFRSGNSHAVRIPPARNLRGAYDALAALPDDFFADGREHSRLQSSNGR